MTVSLFFRNCV